MRERMFGAGIVAFAVTATLWAAADSFVGEWHLNPSKTTLIDQVRVERVAPTKYAFDFGIGSVETIALDGRDQPGAAGTTLAVTVEAPGVWRVVRKKDGRMLLTAVWTLSEDSKTLTDNYEEFGDSGSITRVEYVYTRTDGTSGFAGTWESATQTLTSAYVLQVSRYQNDGLSLVYPTAEIMKNVRFDGRDYPTAGRNAAPGSTSSGRRLNDHSLEITDKVTGKVRDTQQLTVSSDSKSLTITVHRVGHRAPDILVFERRQ